MILFDGVQSLDVTGPLEVFAGANSWRAQRGHDPLYDIRTASLGGQPVRTSSGLRLAPDEDLRENGGRDPDVLIVPGGSRATRWPRPSSLASSANRSRPTTRAPRTALRPR